MVNLFIKKFSLHFYSFNIIVKVYIHILIKKTNILLVMNFKNIYNIWYDTDSKKLV